MIVLPPEDRPVSGCVEANTSDFDAAPVPTEAARKVDDVNKTTIQNVVLCAIHDPQSRLS